jgi:signal transduction histidine kinase/ActR/RegA family two-component response regulator
LALHVQEFQEMSSSMHSSEIVEGRHVGEEVVEPALTADTLSDVMRLNLVLECVSECAGLIDIEAVSRLVGERLRWLFDFDSCVLALKDGDVLRWQSMRAGAERLSPSLADAGDACQNLARAAMATGAPAIPQPPMLGIAHPLGDPDRPSGALCIHGPITYSYRDLRFLHHVCAGLGSALARIEQTERLATALTVAAERSRVSRDEARAANRAKDTFLATLGHELKNPLSAVIAAAELLRRETSGSTRSRVEIVARQARQLDRLVGDLLDVSRVTTGKVSLRCALIDLREVASKGAESAQPGMSSKGQHLVVDFPERPAMVDGDEVRLAQVISNLLVNASAYSPAGSRVELVVGIGVGEVVVEVRDEGIGIAPEMLSGIFDLFVQGGRSQELAPGGLGLGLGVSRALVQLHGGRLSASSEGAGRGSTFRFALPHCPPLGEQERPTANVERATQCKPARILLVDDNVDSAEAIAELLRASGHDVLVTHGPAEALASAATFDAQVAVLDIGLQTMDGYRLAQEIRLQLGLRAPTMIALTGYGQESDRAHSIACGFAAHLTKPVSLEELLASIQDVVGSETRQGQAR